MRMIRVYVRIFIFVKNVYINTGQFVDDIDFVVCLLHTRLCENVCAPARMCPRMFIDIHVHTHTYTHIAYLL